MPVVNGKQTIYTGITLAGKYTPDESEDGRYELKAGTYELVPTKIKSDSVVK